MWFAVSINLEICSAADDSSNIFQMPDRFEMVANWSTLELVKHIAISRHLKSSHSVMMTHILRNFESTLNFQNNLLLITNNECIFRLTKFKSV